jgi:hypothetical protein
MRPIDKGGPPATVYADYRDAAPDLVALLGHYCSYCERRFETHLAVEHIQPKLLATALRTAWSNFLLGCVNCNSCKGDTPVTLTDHYWPDADNTLRAFEYLAGGIVAANSSLSTEQAVKAAATLALTGIDRHPGNTTRPPTPADRRWEGRREVWALAQRCVQQLANNNSPEVRELIVEVALARGIFSIWWTVFEHDVDMRRRFRKAFRGTAAICFDQAERAVPRPGGQV